MASKKAKTVSRRYRKSEAYLQKLAQSRGFSKANKFNEYMNTNFYSSSVSVAELREVRQALAKRANQRLVRAERASSEVSGMSYGDMGASRVAKNYLLENKRAAGRKAIRFNETLTGKGQAGKLTRNELIREITALQDFLGSESSTVTGARKIEKERLARFAEKGLESVAKTKDFYDFLGSNDYKYLVGQKGENFDSESIMEMYQRASDAGASPEDIKEAFHSYVSNRMEMDDYESSLKSLENAFKGAGFNLGKSK